MKKGLKYVSFIFLLLKMCVIFGQENVKQKRIFIDVGHGGNDSGAIGLNDMKEKDVVLNVALEIFRQNKQLDKPLDIYLSRFTDTFISLSDRTKLGKTLKPDVFISMHCNHSNNPNARGVEVYVGKNLSEYSKQSTWLGFQLQAVFKKQLGFESRGVKFADFQVLRESIDYYPAVLLELGFLSNLDECNYFANKQKIALIAQAILFTIKKIK